MKDVLHIALVQTNLIWENIDANLERLSRKIEQINEVDVVVLPEMFTTGFTMNSRVLAEEMIGKSVRWMQHLARIKDCTLIGSLIIHEGAKDYNRALVVPPTGTVVYYDKRHLFRMGGEHNFYARGNSRLIANIGNWRLCPLICYDLRFPVWSRNISDYDVLIYIANWPESRKTVWKTLLMARAIENQCYVVGVNRIGKDGMGVSYSGDSAVVDPIGKLIGKISPYEDKVEIITLSMTDLSDFRKKFPVGKDADNFEIIFD